MGDRDWNPRFVILQLPPAYQRIIMIHKTHSPMYSLPQLTRSLYTSLERSVSDLTILFKIIIIIGDDTWHLLST